MGYAHRWYWKPEIGQAREKFAQWAADVRLLLQNLPATCEYYEFYPEEEEKEEETIVIYGENGTGSIELNRSELRDDGHYIQIPFVIRGHEGQGQPVITDTEICFNGDAEHNQEWDDFYMSLAGLDSEPEIYVYTADGRSLTQEEYDLEYGYYDEGEEDDEDDFEDVYPGFSRCKTQGNPYDLLVTAALVRFAYYFGDDVVIESDGTVEYWQEAAELCQKLFGVGVVPFTDSDEEF